ncbi:MAG: hypothetical protein P8L44_21175 [Opitutales bacterium]|jgi:hypothetical protein|nr:hypothetical protein [bacterium]MDG2170429.1 hypothetical protein [Opitutales bacterium]
MTQRASWNGKLIDALRQNNVSILYRRMVTLQVDRSRLSGIRMHRASSWQGYWLIIDYLYSVEHHSQMTINERQIVALSFAPV